MNQYERMINGKLYNLKIKDEKITELQIKRNEFLDLFNDTKFSDFETREKLCRKYFHYVGKNLVINKPFYCDYAAHISVGDNFFANFNCIMLDVCEINIGSNVFLGPNVKIFTAAHPIDKDVRASGLEYGKKVTIGNDVWIGGGSVINPGVSIGDNVVIGSNSTVTKDIPSNVVACGNPCRILRNITNKDKAFWEEKADEFYEELKK